MFVFFLCLLLSLQGYAAWQLPAPQAPCPMMDMTTMMTTEVPSDTVSAVAATDSAALLADCCNDPETFALSGQPCKNLQSCFAPTAGMPPPLSIAVNAQFVQALKAATSPALSPGVASRLWRPPTSI